MGLAVWGFGFRIRVLGDTLNIRTAAPNHEAFERKMPVYALCLAQDFQKFMRSPARKPLATIDPKP